MTWLEIIDTTVKVGLGAVISGAVALLLSRRSQKAELWREYLRRRQGFLDLFMEDFEPLHLAFFEEAGKTFAMLSTIDAGFSADIEPVSDKPPQVESIEDDLRYKAGRTLYKLQARLLYLGLEEVAGLLSQYQIKLQELTAVLPRGEEIAEFVRIGRHDRDLEHIQICANELSDLRDKIYISLGRADRGEKK